mgnify:CR=1 FL=1
MTLKIASSVQQEKKETVLEERRARVQDVLRAKRDCSLKKMAQRYAGRVPRASIKKIRRKSSVICAQLDLHHPNWLPFHAIYVAKESTCRSK